MDKKVFYLCDRRVPECCGSPNCGVSCFHTDDIFHAESFRAAPTESKDLIDEHGNRIRSVEGNEITFVEERKGIFCGNHCV